MWIVSGDKIRTFVVTDFGFDRYAEGLKQFYLHRSVGDLKDGIPQVDQYITNNVNKRK